ncbi:hypothetical protein EVAR_67424_1 [Eumeta japonica]|uniref:Uncharacterized protein n=1 Tax=Eumeta variegata TaxID=151549 RepID=A0A4C2A5G2_EUMVA|nr:hypothetical protein EVAR_67424_1 [Eumeta japonica]
MDMERVPVSFVSIDVNLDLDLVCDSDISQTFDFNSIPTLVLNPSPVFNFSSGTAFDSHPPLSAPAALPQRATLTITCSSGLQTGACVSASPITSGRVVEGVLTDSGAPPGAATLYAARRGRHRADRRLIIISILMASRQN